MEKNQDMNISDVKTSSVSAKDLIDDPMGFMNKVEKEFAKDNSTAITPVDVQFRTDTVPAFIGNDGEVYTAANVVLRNIGFNEERVKAIKIKWRDDELVSSRGRNFNLSYSNKVGKHSEETFCLSHKILPLALAKISITPALKKEYPKVVEKLIAYQTECADVLYKHFYNKTEVKNHAPIEDPNTPLTREEVAMYFTYLCNTAKEYAAGFDKRIESLIEGHNVLSNKMASVVEVIPAMMSSVEAATTTAKNAATAISRMGGAIAESSSAMYESSKASQSQLKAALKTLEDTDSMCRATNTNLSVLISSFSKLPAYMAGQEAINKQICSAVNKISYMGKTDVKDSSVNQINPKLTTTLAPADIADWRNRMYASAAMIYRVMNKVPVNEKITDYQKNKVLGYVYKEMISSGVDLNSFYNEYQIHYPGRAKINMIAGSDYLRPIAQKAAQKIYDEYRPKLFQESENAEETKDVAEAAPEETKSDLEEKKAEFSMLSKSAQFNSTPPEVKALIQAYADRTGMNYIIAAKQAYKEIESMTNIKLKDLIKSFAKENGYLNCTKAYYVGSNERFMSILRDLAYGKCA